MIKDKLMKALKTAVSDYNDGMGADLAVACSADAWDFNEKQAERLVEMFNTAAAINQEKRAGHETESCELANKENVARILLKGSGNEKKASANDIDYSFYSIVPEKTNATIEARASGIKSMQKAASSDSGPVPSELNVSQRSLYKIIEGKIDLLKSAGATADDIVRCIKDEANRLAIKIAKEIESPWADPDAADLFKAACASEKVIAMVADYSTKVADSDGGRFAKANVFDASKVEPLLKTAAEIDDLIHSIGQYEQKRDFYIQKAAGFEQEIREAVGLVTVKKASSGDKLSDLFLGVRKDAPREVDGNEGPCDEVGYCLKIAEALRNSDVSSEDVARLVEDLEKEAALSMIMPVTTPSMEEAHRALTTSPSIDNEKKRINNVRRAVLLADLMAKDPIIRDADPKTVVEAYKTMVMTSPRVSLDKAQVRAFLRSAVNSVAISPADAKIIADVDKGMSFSNVDRLTALDSSIKDSNA